MLTDPSAYRMGTVQLSAVLLTTTQVATMRLMRTTTCVARESNVRPVMVTTSPPRMDPDEMLVVNVGSTNVTFPPEYGNVVPPSTLMVKMNTPCTNTDGLGHTGSFSVLEYVPE